MRLRLRVKCLERVCVSLVGCVCLLLLLLLVVAAAVNAVIDTCCSLLAIVAATAISYRCLLLLLLLLAAARTDLMRQDETSSTRLILLPLASFPFAKTLIMIMPRLLAYFKRHTAAAIGRFSRKRASRRNHAAKSRKLPPWRVSFSTFLFKTLPRFTADI